MNNKHEPRYLVYKSFNGMVHTEIQYGSPQNRIGEKPQQNELARFEIRSKYDDMTIDQLKTIYPLEVKNEAPVNS